MKKILLTLLVVVVALGLLAGAGFAGYRIGYANGTSTNGAAPGFGRSFQMHPQLMPHDDFSRGFEHNSMMRPGGFNGRNMGFFSPLRSLWNIAILGLVIWFIYWLFTKSGWQISRKMESAAKSDSTDPEGN